VSSTIETFGDSDRTVGIFLPSAVERLDDPNSAEGRRAKAPICTEAVDFTDEYDL
jgi:hypothetical protein